MHWVDNKLFESTKEIQTGVAKILLVSANKLK